MRISDWSSDVCSSDLAYGTVNASLGLKHESGWSVSLWAKNLFDKYYWSAVASNTNVVVRFANQPRTWGLTVGYDRSEEHTSDLQSLMRISYAVFCLQHNTIRII